MTPGSITTILDSVGEVSTSTWGWFGTVANLFVTTPILQLGIAMLVIGFVVGILSRLIRV